MCDNPSCVGDDIISISAKCSDLFSASLNGIDYHGYVPHDMKIGGGDYVRLAYCLDCGKIQGEFPKDLPEFYTNKSEDEDDEDIHSSLW